MTVEIQPDDEKLIAEKLQTGEFRSVDEVIHHALTSLSASNKNQAAQSNNTGRKSLAQLFAESPFAGLAMDFERFQDTSSDL